MTESPQLNRSRRQFRRPIVSYKRLAALAVLTVSAVACQGTPRMSAQGSQVVSTCPTPNAPDYYLRLEKGGYLLDTMSRHLRLAQVEPLWCGASRPATFRLLYLPSHRPALIVSVGESGRNWLGQPRWVLETVRFDDPRSDRAIDSPNGPRVTHRDKSALSDRDATELLNAISSKSFWNASSWEERGVDDGTIILIEGQQEGIYRAIGRWSIDAPMFELASVFVRTAKLSETAELEDVAYRIGSKEGDRRKSQ
jgi:hypothetical protein